VADSLCDELPLFAWRLRAEAFIRFGYDPDGVFTERRDSYDFGAGYSTKVIYASA
jgi:hypothetical protein